MNRVRDVAIRMGLGATRARLVRQFMTESVLLASCGGAAGLLVSVWASTAIVSLFRVGPLPVVLDADLDGRVLAFTTALSLLTGLAFGVLPAIKTTAVDLRPALKASVGSRNRRERLATGKLLTVSQIALALVLLSATGMLVRSLHHLHTVDAGFHREDVLLFSVDITGTDPQVADLSGGLLERLHGLPGVEAVSFSTASPLATDEEVRRLEIPGATPAGEGRSAFANRVTEYFSTFGVAVLRGRGLTAQDSSTTPRVAVVNETLARAYFGGPDPVGRTLIFPSVPEEPVTIVGVARDARQRSLREPAPRMVYLPLAQAEERPASLTVALRTTQRPRAVDTAVRRAVSGYDRDLTVSYVRTLEEQIDASLVRERVLAWLSTGFGLVALVLACVGSTA